MSLSRYTWPYRITDIPLNRPRSLASQSSGSGTIRPRSHQSQMTRSRQSHSVAMDRYACSCLLSRHLLLIKYCNSGPRAPLSSFARSSVHASSSVSQVSSQRRSQLQRHADTLYGDDSESDYDGSSEHDDGRDHRFDHGFRGIPY